MNKKLLELAEQYLGSIILPTEFTESEKYAQRKLDLIIQREGDAGGARREPWYLAQLIAEAVRSSRISQFTIDLAHLCRYAKEQMGLKKEQLA